MALSKITAKFQTTLAAEFLDTGTTFTLTGYTDGTGNAITGIYSFVIEEGTDYEEFIRGTVGALGVVTSLTRGLDYSDGVSAVPALYKDHYRGAIVKITNFSILEEIRRQLEGTDALTNLISYATDLTPTDDKELAPKKYVDDTASSVGTTNLAEGTSTETTVKITSSTGTDATMVSASTTRAGLLTKAK